MLSTVLVLEGDEGIARLKGIFSVTELEGLVMRYQPTWLLLLIGGAEAVQVYNNVSNPVDGKPSDRPSACSHAPSISFDPLNAAGASHKHQPSGRMRRCG